MSSKSFKVRKFGVFLLSSLLIAVTLLMTACSPGKSAVDKVVVTYATGQINVPTHVEKNEGALKKAFGALDLEMEYSNISNGADQITALMSGDIQILNGIGGSSVILSAANSSDIVILSMYSTAPKTFAMFSTDESLSTPESLRGLTIAGPKGTNLHELLAAYLETAGMKISDVDFMDMDIPSAVAALKAGSVDVALAGGTAAFNLEKAGTHMICNGEGLIAATVVTASTKKYAENNPEIIDAFLKTQKEIIEEISEDEEKCLEITAKETDMELDVVREMFQRYDYDPEISDEDITLLQATEQFLYDCGMIEEHMDVKDLIYR